MTVRDLLRRGLVALADGEGGVADVLDDGLTDDGDVAVELVYLLDVGASGGNHYPNLPVR